ncbi:hypothetical protein [Arthrobacter sp. 18067]|uniref:hypothetical protein n=1 Tax=Arthrobacter sp. 18067 TaxID=2681413 RepID=UPI001358AB15|nr:hypothetical protein [Arthrobacter sp. 18067]
MILEIELLGGPLDGQVMAVDESMRHVVMLVSPPQPAPCWAQPDDIYPTLEELPRLIYSARDTWNPRTRRRQYVLD